MSRLYQSLRPFLRSARFASRVPSGQTVRIERVKVKKPWLAWLPQPIRRNKGTVAFILLILLVPTPSFVSKEDMEKNKDNNRGEAADHEDDDEVYDDDEDEEDEEDEDDEDDADDEDDEDDDEDRLFVPLPLTLRKVPGKPYFRNSPEWKEFVRMSRNGTEGAVRGAISQTVCRLAKSTPGLTQRFGTDMEVASCFLDVQYPRTAPPAYECTGLLRDRDGWRLETFEVHPHHAKVVERAYWPRPLAMGLWTFGKEMYADTLPRIAKTLGLSYGSQPTDPIRRALSGPAPLPTTTQTMGHKTTNQPEKVNDTRPMASSTDQPASAASSGASGNKAPSRPDNELSPEDEERKRVILKAIQNSVNAYWMERASFLPDPPPGAAHYSGHVELKTPSVYLIFEVSAWYEPKHNRIDGNTMKVAWTSVRPRVLV